jgi:hypothetical protein
MSLLPRLVSAVSHLPRLPLDGQAMLPLAGQAKGNKKRKGALGVMTGITTRIAMHMMIMATIG